MTSPKGIFILYTHPIGRIGKICLCRYKVKESDPWLFLKRSERTNFLETGAGDLVPINGFKCNKMSEMEK